MTRILTLFANCRPEPAAPGRPVALLAAAFVLAGGVISPVHAGEVGSGKTKNATAIQAPVVNCTCRYLGTDYHLGDAVCLNGPGGPRMATCDMVLNNTSWRMSETPCPSASLSPVPMSVSRISWKG